LNLGQSLGRPPIGYFSDNVGRLNMAGIMTFACGVFSLVIWMFAKNFGVVVFFAILGGTVAGTFWAVAAPVTAEVMGLKRLPSALSITWLVLVLPTTCEFGTGSLGNGKLICGVVSEAIGLEIVSANNGSYTGAILFTGFMYIGAAISLWMVRAWKIGELEEQDAAEGKSEGAHDIPLGEFQRSAFLKRMTMWRKV
jgi:MFS family permease